MADKKPKSFLTSCLENIEKEYCAKFHSKMHTLTMSYTKCVNDRIVLQIRIFQKNKPLAIMKSAMYVQDFKDLDFIRAYLAGLSLTLAAE